MSGPTIRISEASQQILQELADQTGQTKMDVLDKALDAYRRESPTTFTLPAAACAAVARN